MISSIAFETKKEQHNLNGIDYSILNFIALLNYQFLNIFNNLSRIRSLTVFKKLVTIFLSLVLFLKRMGATINGVGRSIDHWQLDSSVCF